MKKVYLLMLAAVCVLAGCTKKKLTADNIDEIVKDLTLDEKISLVVGAGNTEFLGYGNTKKIVPGAGGTTTPIDRLGITPTVLTDGPAGIRIDTLREGDPKRYYHTGFPIGTALASSWDAALIEEVGKTIGNEALEYGIDMILAPGMNLHRDPLGGRNFEYYSEDPLVTGKMAAAYIRGMQSEGITTCPKHFAVNNQETNRKDLDVIIDPQPLRELYLRAFEIMVKESKTGAIMSAYNMINGQQCMESKDLLTTVLRDEWGFDGVVVTDWANKGWRVSEKEVAAGNDIIMPGTPEQAQEIKDAIQKGTLSEAELDLCVARILKYITRTPRYKHYKYSNNPDLKAHAEVSRRAAEEGIVLLENFDGTLPLRSDRVKKVGLFGISSYNFIAVGTGSGNVKTRHTVNLLEGLANKGIETNSYLSAFYQKVKDDAVKGREYDELGYDAIPEPSLNAELIKNSAYVDDMAIVTIGRSCGEGADRNMKRDFYLSDTEKNLIDQVCKVFHAKGKKVVVILNVSGVIETASWKHKPDAVVLTWLPGQQAGDAVCRVLMGDVNPSGHLTMTFPQRYEDCSTYANFPYEYEGPKAIGNYPKIPRNPAQRNIHYVKYEEGLFVGYRYFDTRNIMVTYPFGYGLSYTTFSHKLKNLKTYDDGSYLITVEVSNTGKVAGKDVVQLYACLPGAEEAGRPSHQLVSFGKTALLQPGETGLVELPIDVKSLAVFDPQTNQWILQKGDYTIQVAENSRKIMSKTTLTVDADRVIEKVHPVLLPTGKPAE